MKVADIRIGLVIRSGPFQGRSARDQLDVALAAASLGFELELFFTEEGILQLVADRDAQAGGLPGGHKGWKALPGLTSVTAWAAERVLSSHVDASTNFMLEVKPASQSQMAGRLADCEHCLVV